MVVHSFPYTNFWEGLRMITALLEADPVADSPHDELLRDSAFLLASGFHLASAMMAQASLESFLGHLCTTHGCQPNPKRLKYGPREARVDALRAGGVFDKADAKTASELYTIASAVTYWTPFARSSWRKGVSSYEGN